MKGFCNNPHAQSVEQVLSQIQSNRNGLSAIEAAERLKRWGENVLPSQGMSSAFIIFIRQFKNPLILLLLMIGLLALLLQHTTDAAFTGLVLLLNAIIGTVQEYGAEKSADALKKLTPLRANVLRDNKILSIRSHQLVIGDVVYLESGNKIPADLRIIESTDLSVDESLLTGESLPIEDKNPSVLFENTNLADRKNMLFSGTLVTRGRVKAVVTAIAMQTELGKIAKNVLGGSEQQTPLTKRMHVFTKRLTIVFLFIIAIISILQILRGEDVASVLLFAIATGVAAIPEGLPVAMTVALAVSSRRMAKRNVIVRRLAAVESLGSCTYICTDKTGTLTLNKLSAELILTQDFKERQRGQWLKDVQLHADYKELLSAIALCNERAGDAVDVALDQLANEAKITMPSHKLIKIIPFESERKFAASIHLYEDENIVSLKGAPETILSMCEVSLDFKSKYLSWFDEVAAKGFKLIAFAVARSAKENKIEINHFSNQFQFLGAVAFMDPPRPESAAAVKECRMAGVEVAMLTGDHAKTAQYIAGQLGIDKSNVYARVEPIQKLEIVEALIKKGHFVAVTGDGANDAPALKAANVGIAMGLAGTDVAKESADLILADDKFSSIVAGIEEGRVAYENIRKVIYMLLATGMGEIVLLFLSVITGLPMPLTAIQLLWLNVVSEGLQSVALAFEPKEGDEMQVPPRSPQSEIFDAVLFQRVAFSALLLGGISFAAFYFLIRQGQTEAESRNFVLLLMVFFENVLVLSARSMSKFTFFMNPFRNPFLIYGLIAAQLVHIAAMYISPTQMVLGVSPVSTTAWGSCVMLSALVYVIIEVSKKIRIS